MPPKKEKMLSQQELKEYSKIIPSLKAKDEKKKDLETIFDKKK